MIPGPRLSLSLLCMALSSLPPLTRLTWEFLFTSPGPPDPGLRPGTDTEMLFNFDTTCHVMSCHVMHVTEYNFLIVL